MTVLVAPLEVFGSRDVDRAGGKGANLGELVRAGYPVPPGFVVTTAAYTELLERSDLSGAIAARLAELQASRDDADAPAGRALRAHFAEMALAGDVREAIVHAYAALGGGPVAVRSSATAEDLPGAAFAGQQDTYLNIIGADEVVDAVRRCWGSLWTDRAIAYRRRLRISPEEVRIAVVVQSMVQAEMAGVLLTANPVTGAREEIVLDASSGLGEAVVSGRVTPDHYVLDGSGRIQEWSPGQGEVVIRSTAGGGVAVDTTEQGEPRRLPDDILRTLAGLGSRVAEHFGTPQDIEWAYADGRVWLLQARPMTALPPPPLRLNRIQRVTGPQIIEMLPIRPYPLDMCAWIVPGIGRMVTRLLDEMTGLRVDLSEALPEVDGVVDRFVPPVPHPTRRMLTAPMRNIPRFRRYDPAAWTGDPRFIRFEQRVADLAQQDARTLPWEELKGVPRQALDALDLIVDLRSDYMPRAGVDLLRLGVVLTLLGLRKTFPLLILGAPTRTLDANRALEALADHVRTEPTLRRNFSRLDPDSLVEHIWRQPSPHEFRTALEAFVDEYGHRETASPLLLSSPTWSDSPATVIGAISALVEQRGEPISTAGADAALQRVLGHPWVLRTRSRTRVLRAVEAARVGVALREDTHFHGTRTLPALRHALLEMGRRLAAAGIIREDDEVFHLRLDELEELADPRTLSTAEAERISGIVRRRAARRMELSGVPLIATAVLFPHDTDDAEAIVTGTPASGGLATGPVRIIRGPTEFGHLRSGDILVCPYTNPAWTPLFQRAAAVVVDTGGLASHAAIVAREYGIPAVMGTGTATTALADSQIVTVDGDRGRVTIAEDVAA